MVEGQILLGRRFNVVKGKLLWWRRFNMVENKGFTIFLVSNDVFSGNKVEKYTNHWRSNFLDVPRI